MQNIKNFDEALKAMYEEHKYIPALVHCEELFQAYRRAIGRDLEYIDFDGPIWSNKIDVLSDVMVANGVKRFTVSSTYSHVADTIAGFISLGWRLDGMTKVNSGYTEIDPLTENEVPRMSNAFVLAR